MNGGREAAVSHRQGRLSREKARDFFFLIQRFLCLFGDLELLVSRSISSLGYVQVNKFMWYGQEHSRFYR